MHAPAVADAAHLAAPAHGRLVPCQVICMMSRLLLLAIDRRCPHPARIPADPGFDGDEAMVSDGVQPHGMRMHHIMGLALHQVVVPDWSREGRRPPATLATHKHVLACQITGGLHACA